MILQRSESNGLGRHVQVALRQLHRRRVGARQRRGSTSRTSRRSPAARSARSRAPRPRTSNARSTPRTPPRPRWGRTSVGRPRGHTQQDRRPHRAEPGDARRRRDLGQRQARARDARGRPAADGRSLPLLRRLHPRAGGPHLRDRRRHGRLPLPRAARRRRPDHPLELPHAHGGVEAGPRAGGRQLRRAQARRADARVDPCARWSSSAISSRPGCSTSSTASASRRASR